jgi:hypothetical protein
MGALAFGIKSRTGAVLFAALAVITAGRASADPASDQQYLAALHHGGLCCQQQTDSPIPYASPESAIALGKALATDMKNNPTYAAFKNLRGNISHDLGARQLNNFESGELIVIAVHYYAGAPTECQLMKQMGGAAGEAPYWYGPVTYSGGLAVQPDCIKFAS